MTRLLLLLVALLVGCGDLPQEIIGCPRSCDYEEVWDASGGWIAECRCGDKP